MLSLKDARALISEIIKPGPTISLPSVRAIAHAVPVDIPVSEDFPAFDNSAMDGYAVRKIDLQALPSRLPISMELAAGSTQKRELPEGTAAKILTGARLPVGADCIVKQEDTTWLADLNQVEFSTDLENGDFIRRRGEDLTAGQCLIEAGSLLGSAQIACLVAQGIYAVDVIRKPSIGFIVTGDELCFQGDEVVEGRIRSCNGELFETFFASMCQSIKNYGYVRDDREQLKQRVLEAQDQDILLISGGASVGKYDFTHRILQELGYQIHFDKVAVRPGKPLIFATKGHQIVFGVPGNPVSSYIACQLFISHAVALKSGWKRPLQRIKAVLQKKHTKSEKFDMYLRGILQSDSGQNLVDTNLNQSSGALGSLSKANCLVSLPAGKSEFLEGELVDVLPILGWSAWN